MEFLTASSPPPRRDSRPKPTGRACAHRRPTSAPRKAGTSRHGAAPSLPGPYSAAIDGAEIGACAGSCGTAAYLGAAVFVSDIATDPLWADYREVALPHGLRACWSIPILTRGRKVLGTFAMYHREPREPTVRDLMLVDLITQTAALVIDREQAKKALQDIATMVGTAPAQSQSSSSS